MWIHSSLNCRIQLQRQLAEKCEIRRKWFDIIRAASEASSYHTGLLKRSDMLAEIRSNTHHQSSSVCKPDGHFFETQVRAFFSANQVSLTLNQSCDILVAQVMC